MEEDVNDRLGLLELYHRLDVAIVLPGLQSVITGLVAAVGGAGLARLFDLPGGPGAWAIGGGVAGLSLVWIGLLWRWLDLTRPAPQLAGLVNQDDGIIGPELPAPRVRIELVSEDRRHTSIAELPTSQAKLVRLAAGLVEGAPFSEAAWSGGGALFSRREFRDIRAEMMRRGMLTVASDKDVRQGYILTPPGQAAMRYFASLAGGVSPTLPVSTYKDL